jgi:serine protease inhibitor
MKKVIILVLIVILIGLAACTPTAPGDTIKATGMTLKSEKQRNESPEVASSDISSLTDGNGVFAFNLYKLVNQEEGNLFYSPYSISAALAMTYAGARGDTEKQMADTLQFYLSTCRKINCIRPLIPLTRSSPAVVKVQKVRMEKDLG